MSDLVDRAELEVGEWLPHVAGALAILALGLLLAWLLGTVTARALAVLGADRMAARYRLHEALGRSAGTPLLSLVAGRVVRLVVALVVVVAAVSTLGIGGIEPALTELLLYVPRVVAAVVLVVAGLVVGRIVGGWVDRLATQLAVDAPLGRIADALIVAVFALTAAAQLGVPTELLIVLAAIVLVTAGLTAALAFGLGGRDVARELSAGRYVAASYILGDRIEVNAVEGEIEAFEPVAVVVRRGDGRLARIPNHVLLDSVVTTESPAR